MSKRFTVAAFFTTALALLPVTLLGNVRVAGIFGTNMVLQRDMEIPVWGWAEPGETVGVQFDDGERKITKAGDDGTWRVTMPAMAVGGPHRLSVTASNEIVFTDILVGEVWLCSGQSNMEWRVAGSLSFDEEKANANHPKIRHIAIKKRPAGYPENDVQADWQICSPETVGSFTACGYFMARDLIKELDVPIGLINSSWGGTRIEPWTPPEGFAAVPALKTISQQVMLTDPTTPEYKTKLREHLFKTAAWLKKAQTALDESARLEPCPPFPDELKPVTSKDSPHQQPTALYNGMIHAFVGFPIRGAIWYQGESNRHDGMLYYEKKKALIGGWREIWGIGDFPFYFVQIAPYMYGNENPHVVAAFWEAQAACLQIPNTGMVVTNDIGNTSNIHPKNKQEVGRRLALLALARDYGRDGLVCSGPTFKELKLDGARIRVVFDNVGSGLCTRDGKAPTHFEIIGKDTDFVAATAEIDGDAILLSAPEVKEACAMRFAWNKVAEPNLQNKEGLPAGAFRAGEVPERDFLALRVAEAKDYKLAYDLDLSNLGKSVGYTADNAAQIIDPFDRIAYFIELQKPGEPLEYAYVSMDAFTDDIKKIGVPTLGTKANFQVMVRNLNVVSNVSGIKTGTDLSGGNIEFWPNNYGPPNTSKVPNASSGIWDFGDQCSSPSDGYGCMQVHNHDAKQTIFALNNWKAQSNADIGIGNSSGKTRDWTFMKNASQYTVKRLRVLVRPKK